MPARRLFVTTALPYANGPLHLGHVMEYVQADVWVRFQRLRGAEVHFVCADDAHGAPIMLKAEAEGIAPEALVARYAAERPRVLEGFRLSFDHWHSTHSPENTALAQQIYLRLEAEGLIAVRPVEQFYDPVKRLFLADRYVRGDCPRCGAPDQAGDACERCGAAYAPTELGRPRSALSGAVPERRTSEHHFFRLSDPRCVAFLRDWVNTPGRLQREVANKAREWLQGEAGLADWDISRDAPYFGIPIPNAPGKYFYVWLDAPIGYLAALEAHCARRGLDAHALLAHPATEQIHFIGKDIVYFHTLFWPALLRFSGRKVPDRVWVHGFITVSGEKMSKSRGTGLSPQRYLEAGLDPEWLRYYLAAKLNAAVEDVDFNPDDFRTRVNSDLIGKYVNIASRAAGFLVRHFDGQLAYPGGVEALEAEARRVAGAVAEAYEEREFARAMREAMAYADRVNQAYDAGRPWELAKDPARRAELQAVCSRAMHGFWVLSVLLAPVLPATATRVARELYGLGRDFVWADAERLPERVAPYRHLLERVREAHLEALFAPPPAQPSSRSPQVHAEAQQHATAPPVPAPQVTIEEFNRLDLRVARILEAATVEGADRLLRLVVDLGEERRTVYAGIRSAYAPESLVGRLVVVVANLAPRRMRFGVSEGMILCASAVGAGPFLIAPDSGAEPGMTVK